MKEARPRQGFFERPQYDKLLAELPDYLRLPFSIGYFSGMREGEILGLEWDQVKFLEGVIQLRAGETKNGEAREIPIIPELRVLLLAQRAKRQAYCPYVCFRLDRRGDAVKAPRISQGMVFCLVRVGLGKMEPKLDRVTREPLYASPRGPRSKPKPKMVYRGMIFHDLRRSGARALLHAGVPEKVCMAIGGWKTRSVFDRYSIVSPRTFEKPAANWRSSTAGKSGTFQGQSALKYSKPVCQYNDLITT